MLEYCYGDAVKSHYTPAIKSYLAAIGDLPAVKSYYANKPQGKEGVLYPGVDFGSRTAKARL